MLLQFTAQNYRSFRERQSVSLVASSLTDSEEPLVAAPDGGKVLPAIVVYGANASGKTNLVSALRHVRWSVLFSHNRREPEEAISRSWFRLDPHARDEPSRFEIDFFVDNVRYRYGFEETSRRYEKEWLYSFSGSRRQKLFQRLGQDFEFGRAFRGRNKVIADLTRPNSLFLASAAQNDHEELTRLTAFFRSIYGDLQTSVDSGNISFSLSEKEVDQRSIDFLNAIGTGVVGYQKKEREVTEEMREFQRQLISALAKVSDRTIDFSDLERKGSKIFQLAHRATDGNDVFFNLDRESAGTRRLLLLLNYVFDALDKGTVLVVDELDASIHTQACETIMALFLSKNTNSRHAQLVVTTHDTNLLRSPLLRRDQVWFAEKDEIGATHIYPLTDIRTRKGDDIEKGYLQGRFGAVPLAGEFSTLIKAS